MEFNECVDDTMDSFSIQKELGPNPTSRELYRTLPFLVAINYPKLDVSIPLGKRFSQAGSISSEMNLDAASLF
ncbi:hypothetical protein DSO57_1005668 [Entomophthora muscae]|uniref:Uncharacterized protein n=1 Tax=Entomophthora muscae TaxID=34485 RepID=A0ACC2RYY6_9FUNG|nr:hypothetical protein DSO57_1005668 [Entomophthora muscae]